MDRCCGMWDARQFPEGAEDEGEYNRSQMGRVNASCRTLSHPEAGRLKGCSRGHWVMGEDTKHRGAAGVF